MGELLFDWARNILFFMVFLSVISHLLADRSYEKYIRFFAGMVLILNNHKSFKRRIELPGAGWHYYLKNFLISYSSLI